MSMEQGLCAQVVMLRQNNLKITAANKNKNDEKFKFQGQSARSQRWFDLDFGWIKVNFITHEPDLYRRIFQSRDNTQDTNTSKIFQTPMGNSKSVKTLSFTVVPQYSSIVRIRRIVFFVV